MDIATLYDTATAGFDVLTRYREWEVPHDRNEVTVTHNGGFENGEAVVGVVKRYPLDACRRGILRHESCGDYTACSGRPDAGILAMFCGGDDPW